MKGILGRKIGMTEKFTKDGKVIPVTVIEIEPNVVTQVKTVETDGYNAIQIGTVDKKEKHATKAEIGHAKKAGVAPKRFLKEIRIDNPTDYTVGSVIEANIFEVGERVDVTGTSKGKGFQGPIKRHHQSRGPETHGSRYHRRPGSMGTLRPMRVLKGKKLAGHMGHETVTIQNLEIIEVCLADKYILVSGNVPGPKQGLVLIRDAKKPGKVVVKDIIINEEEKESAPEVTSEVVPVENTEVVEETTETAEVVEEAPVEETPAETEEVKEETTEEVVEEASEEVAEETTEVTDEKVEETTEE